MREPLFDRKGRQIPPWDDPRLSPQERWQEWMKGHVKPGIREYVSLRDIHEKTQKPGK